VIATRMRLLATAGLVALASSALAVLSPIAPSADAHSSVLSTTPAEGQHVTDPPQEVAMTFTTNLIEVGAIILVVNEQGANWANGGVRLDGSTAVQPLKAKPPDGNYQVRWRVVSSDGHPISGTFDFSTGSAHPGAANTTPTLAGSIPTPESQAEPVDASDGGRGLPLVVVGAIGAAIGFVLFVGVVILLPRKTHS
jgi:methionine-rich copper-binding protein CopC